MGTIAEESEKTVSETILDFYSYRRHTRHLIAVVLALALYEILEENISDYTVFCFGCESQKNAENLEWDFFFIH